MTTTITRRLALQLLGSAAALPFIASAIPAVAQEAAGRIIVLSDLHSAYERTAELLATLEAEVSGNPVPHIILINGDVFELGNVVAVRSAGIIDWTFLEAVAALAPTVLNIGNHEPDLDTDLANVIAQAEEIGITVVSNITDTRTGELYTSTTTDLTLGDLPVRVVGIATDKLNTYPKDTREALTIPEPAAWATENLAGLLEGDVLPVVLSHAGVVADRAILPLLADGTLIVGGHDHLTFTHDEGKTRYVHTGSWSSTYTVVTVAADKSMSVEQSRVRDDVAANEALATLISETLAEHLTAEELAAIGTSPAAMSLAETGRFVAESMAAAGEGDIGFIGHTTLGNGLPLGEVSKYAFDSVVRFDGKLMVAEVNAATLAEILAVVNQDEAQTLEQRTGDFLYAAPTSLPTKDVYRLVTNDWSATNQKSYFGREDLVFTPGPDVALKALVVAALK
ncbi:metallophosphoesterase [Devosia riboflavina]